MAARGLDNFFSQLDVLAEEATCYIQDPCIARLNLPKWEGRTLPEQTRYLRTHYRQGQLVTMFCQVIEMMGSYPFPSAEFDFLCEELEPIWYALPPELRP